MGEKYLRMTFVLDDGSKTSIRLRGVKEDIEDTTVSSLMDLIIEKDVFKYKGKSFVKKSSAQYEQTNTDEVILSL